MNAPARPPLSRDAIVTFIETHTRILTPPLVPEIRLHLAEESLPIWQKTEEELNEINVPPPFWAFAWAGGQALARYLLDHPEQVRGRKIIDLGTGSGLTAIAAMKAGARHGLAADVDIFSVAACGINAARNGVTLNVTGQDLLAAAPARADVLLIGDLFYERPLAERVMAYATAFQEDGGDVLVGDPCRSYFPREAFDCAAEYRVPVTRELEDAEIKRSAVWRLRTPT